MGGRLRRKFIGQPKVIGMESGKHTSTKWRWFLWGAMGCSLLVLFAFLALVFWARMRMARSFVVTIENQSSHAICRLSFYPAGSYHLYAPNLLRKFPLRLERIAPGESVAVYIERGAYDIRIETCDGLVWGTDVFLVPQETFWAIPEESLFAPVR